MLIAELINSCSHERIAQAALMSIGPDFYKRVDAVARRLDQSSGTYAAARVSEFAKRADGVQWSAVAKAMSGQDMPVLSGLRYILETNLDRKVRLSEQSPHVIWSRRKPNSQAGCAHC